MGHRHRGAGVGVPLYFIFQLGEQKSAPVKGKPQIRLWDTAMWQAPWDGEDCSLSLRNTIREEPRAISLPCLAQGKDPAKLVH